MARNLLIDLKFLMHSICEGLVAGLVLVSIVQYYECLDQLPGTKISLQYSIDIEQYDWLVCVSYNVIFIRKPIENGKNITTVQVFFYM